MTLAAQLNLRLRDEVRADHPDPSADWRGRSLAVGKTVIDLLPDAPSTLTASLLSSLNGISLVLSERGVNSADESMRTISQWFLAVIDDRDRCRIAYNLIFALDLSGATPEWTVQVTETR